MLLAELIAASSRVAATRSRLAKPEALAEVLRRLAPAEIALGVAYLSGDTRQGKAGVGYAALQDALETPAAAAGGLTVLDLDRALEALASLRGAGSGGERRRALRELFARATAEEQDFIARLLVGELRQGALEGVMVDA